MARRMKLRVDGELSEELLSAFPNVTAHAEGPTCTLVGTVVDQQELQGLLALLDSLGVRVIDVIVVPD